MSLRPALHRAGVGLVVLLATGCADRLVDCPLYLDIAAAPPPGVCDKPLDKITQSDRDTLALFCPRTPGDCGGPDRCESGSSDLGVTTRCFYSPVRRPN